MPAGRPRQLDRLAIVDALVEWAQREDSTNLCAFAKISGIPSRKLWLWSTECDEFRDAYEYAKDLVGARRDELINAKLMAVENYKLNAHVYDYFMRQEHRDDLEFKSKLDRETGNIVPEIISNKLDKMFDQMESSQDTSRKARNTKSND